MKYQYRNLVAAALAAGLFVLTPAQAFAAEEIGPGVSSGTSTQSSTQSAWTKVNGVYLDDSGNAITGAVLRGVSVSKWQGNIDWKKAAADDVSFAWIRMGSFGYEGEYTMDEYFDQNMKNAAAAGIHTAPYIYLQTKTVEEAKAAARYAVSVASKYTVDYPIAVDVESDYIMSLSVQELTDVVNAFCQVIAESGYTPIIYSDYNKFTTKMDTNQFSYDIWLARYGVNTEYKNRTVWQATQTGSVSGISGNVCLEFAFKDYAGGSAAQTAEGPGAVTGSQTVEPGSGGPGAAAEAQAANHADGWEQKDGVWYYYEGGKAAVGWKQLSGIWYYLDPANGGQMVSGVTMTIDGVSYRFDGSGAMQ